MKKPEGNQRLKRDSLTPFIDQETGLKRLSEIA